MVPAMVRDKFVIRFCVVAEHTTEDDIKYAWSVIRELTAKILSTSTERKIDSERKEVR